MAPPTVRFFAGAFQPYSSMMSANSHAPGQFFPSPHKFQTSVAPLAVYPPPGPDFGFNYGMFYHTSPTSLFATVLRKSGARDGDEYEDDAESDEDDNDDAEAIRRDPRRNIFHHFVRPDDI
ncbi:hypothetical protein V6N13_053952 [Hibiscus sabdariffa]